MIQDMRCPNCNKPVAGKQDVSVLPDCLVGYLTKMPVLNCQHCQTKLQLCEQTVDNIPMQFYRDVATISET